MIYIDRRTGSKDLRPLIKHSLLVTLDFGDAAFDGYGPEGEVCVGVERKNIRDLVNSISTGRLSAHQLPGMLDSYYHSYLIVEGIWKPDKDGTLLVSTTGGKTFYSVSRGKQVWTVEGVCHYLTTVETMLGVSVRQTKSAKDTARMIEYLESWWNKKWSKHSSHQALHKDGKLYHVPRSLSFDERLNHERPTLTRRLAAELPGVGVDRSKDVAEYFGEVGDMFAATEADWRKVPGIGKVTAKMAYEELHKTRKEV